MTDVTYADTHVKHSAAAVQLVLQGYRRERRAVSFLPPEGDFEELLTERVGPLLSEEVGAAAFSGGRLVGYLAGRKVDDLFGTCGGVHVPLYGHGVVRGMQGDIYRELYRRAAHTWVKEELLTHAVTCFAHHPGILDTWFWLGFGMRCVDSMRQVKPLAAPSCGVEIVKIQEDRVDELEDIVRAFSRYFTAAPLFMPEADTDPVKDLQEWLDEPGRHLWAAYRSNRALGYIRIQPEAMAFPTAHPDVANVTGAFVLDSARHTGVGRLLLSVVQDWLLDAGIPLCGVDFESFNPAARFWNRHFTPYSYTLVRRIDERVLSDVAR